MPQGRVGYRDGDGGVARGLVGAADGEEGAAEGEALGQVVCREERGCRVDLLKGRGTGPLVTEVFSRSRGAHLLSSHPFSSHSKRDGKNT